MIRGAARDDAPAIVACVTAAYAHYVERIGKPPAPMLEDYALVVHERAVFVAVVDGAIVGVLVLVPQAASLLLDNIAVHPAYQRRGIGHQLADFAEQEACRLGYSAIQLYTNVVMVENIDWYARLGFVETARREENGYQRVFMEKTLAI